MLLKNSVVVAAMLLLSPFTVVGRTLKADKSSNKCGKRFEETIDALTTRIDKLTMLVEQIATSVRKNDKNDSDSAIAEFCGQVPVANAGACAIFIDDEDFTNTPDCIEACNKALNEIVSNTPEQCAADCINFFGISLKHRAFCNTACLN